MLLDPGCAVCQALPGPVCPVCRAELRSAPAVDVPGLDRCRVGFALDDHSRPIIAAFKYGRQRRLARWIAVELGVLIPRSADLITWVPATPERRRSRGFDQAEELARAFSRVTGVPAHKLLDRRGSDERQTGRSRVERLAGPVLALVREPPPFVVLIDDVVTTGSSMRVSAAKLRSGSAMVERIVGCAVAATPSHQPVHLPDLTNRSSIREWT